MAGEGDLLAQVERLRRQLAEEGLFEPQKRLHRPSLPRTIGVVSGEGGKARDDVLAGLRRRGWAGAGRVGGRSVQDRHAAPAITRALQDLAACAEIEVIVIARGGGSLADLFAFCDETLCRTVALLRVPVISSVGHHSDHTLIDDVAAVACSTPTHAAEAAVPVECTAARAAAARAGGPARAPERAAGDRRARPGAGAALARARQHVERHRTRLHQHARELRASARRAGGDRQAAHRDHRARARAQGARRGRGEQAAPAASSSAGPRARRPRAATHARARLRTRRGARGRARHLRGRRAPAAELTLRMRDGTVSVRPQTYGEGT